MTLYLSIYDYCPTLLTELPDDLSGYEQIFRIKGSDLKVEELYEGLWNEIEATHPEG